MWIALGYAWQVAINILYLLIIAYVFGQLQGRPEKVVVPMLGLIYVAVRASALHQGLVWIKVTTALDRQISDLRSSIDANYRPDQETYGESSALLDGRRQKS